MIRLLVVDDSMFFRFTIRSIIESDTGIEVVGEATDGRMALELVEELDPDVITMDVEMPEMNGLEAVKEIMSTRPKPVIMVSNYTQEGSDATIQSLEYGAVDFVSKKSSLSQMELARVNNELLEKIHYWGENSLPFVRYRVERKPGQSGSFDQSILMDRIKQQVATPPTTTPLEPGNPVDLAVVAVSTGGPGALGDMLIEMGGLSYPMVVAQHMPERFTSSLADHLARKTGLAVTEGQNGDLLEPGMVVIAPGAKNCTILGEEGGLMRLRVRNGPQTPFKPSADLLFMSAAAVAKSPIAVIMTGMGDDGVRGAREFKKRNFPVIAQSHETCIVDGMPEAARKAGLVTETLSPNRIADRLAKWGKGSRVS